MSKYKIKAVVEKIEFKDTKPLYIHLKGTAEYQWYSSSHKEKVFNVLENFESSESSGKEQIKIVDELIVQLEETTNLPNSYLISVLTHSFCENTPFIFELGNATEEIYSIVSITKPGVD